MGARVFSCQLKSRRFLVSLRGICLFTLLFLSVTAWAEGDNSELITVVAIGRGENKTDALENAVEEALRKCTGTLLLSREELTDDSFRKTVIQASRGSVKKTEILSSETQEDGLTVLTVKVQIDTKAITAIVTPEIKSEGVNVRLYKRPLLDKGLNALYNFFKSLNLLDFMEVSLYGTPEVNINTLKIAVQLAVREDVYQEKIVNPLSRLLDDVTLPAGLNEELKDAPISNRQAATFYIMGANLSFKGWNLPKDFLDAFQRGGRFTVSGKTPLHTQKYLWLHVSLFDESGLEFQRVPIPVYVTNILFFSLWGGSLNTPWYVVNGTRPSLTVLCAPFFGFAQGRERNYLSRLPQPELFELRLPQEILLRISRVELKLAIE